MEVTDFDGSWLFGEGVEIFVETGGAGNDFTFWACCGLEAGAEEEKEGCEVGEITVA